MKKSLYLLGFVLLFSAFQINSQNQVFTVNGVSFKMIDVEGGTFMMGADIDASLEEKPVHKVNLSSFAIGETEVTQELWQAVMKNNPSEFKGLNRPVETISWNDCQVFIRKLNEITGKSFRLPTEAEWEYAARGGKKSKGYLYAGSNKADDVAWYGDLHGETKNVASKIPNELGLYDMSGNVLEWCQDFYGIDYYMFSTLNDPKGPSSGSERVTRGGGCGSLMRNCRVSYRKQFSASKPDHKFHFCGFRLVLDK